MSKKGALTLKPEWVVSKIYTKGPLLIIEAVESNTRKTSVEWVRLGDIEYGDAVDKNFRYKLKHLDVLSWIQCETQEQAEFYVKLLTDSICHVGGGYTTVSDDWSEMSPKSS